MLGQNFISMEWIQRALWLALDPPTTEEEPEPQPQPIEEFLAVFRDRYT